MKMIKLLSTCLLLTLTSAKLLASSRVKKCFNDGDSETCGYSIVVLMELNGDKYNAERIVVTQVSDGENIIPMDKPLEVTLETVKTEIVYDLTRLRLFNKRPQEYVYYGPMGSCPGGCKEVVGDDGKAIKYSSGFCCQCSISAQLGLSSPPHRGNPSCSILDSSVTSHCIRMDDEWYIGSLISTSPRMEYTVGVSTNQGTQFEVTESRDYKKDNITATIVVSIPPYYFDIGGQILLVPQSGSGTVLRVPQHFVSIKGDECNKIGVSYEGFITQGGRCEVVDGSCLGSQIIDYIYEDSIRGPGQVPLYTMLGSPNLFDSHVLYWHLVKPARFIVTVEIDNVDEVHFAVNHSTSANITDVYIKDSNDKNEVQETGYLFAKVVNSGKVPSSLTVIAEAEAGFVFLEPMRVRHFEVNQEHVFEWTIRAKDGTSNTAVWPVVISVQSVKYEELDRWQLNITSKAVVVDAGAQGGNQNNYTGSVRDPEHDPNKGKTKNESCTDCPWYNPICFLSRECFLRGVLQFIGTLLLVLVIGYLVVKGHALRFLKWCLKRCYKKKNKKRENKKKNKDSEKVHITISEYDSSSESSEEAKRQKKKKKTKAYEAHAPYPQTDRNPIDVMKMMHQMGFGGKPAPGYPQAPPVATRPV